MFSPKGKDETAYRQQKSLSVVYSEGGVGAMVSECVSFKLTHCASIYSMSLVPPDVSSVFMCYITQAVFYQVETTLLLLLS